MSSVVVPQAHYPYMWATQALSDTRYLANELSESTVNFDDSDTFELRDDLVVEEIDGDVVVLDLEGNQYFGLNEVAWMIWRDIREEDRSFREIVDGIAESFDIDGERARRDVSGFVESLIEAGLATRRGASTP